MIVIMIILVAVPARGRLSAHTARASSRTATRARVERHTRRIRERDCARAMRGRQWTASAAAEQRPARARHRFTFVASAAAFGARSAAHLPSVYQQRQRGRCRCWRGGTPPSSSVSDSGSNNNSSGAVADVRRAQCRTRMQQQQQHEADEKPLGDDDNGRRRRAPSRSPLPPLRQLWRNIQKAVVATPGVKNADLDDCPFCDATGQQRCDACRGSGRDSLGKCLACGGRGGRTCSVCVGIGKVDSVRKGGTDTAGKYLSQRARDEWAARRQQQQQKKKNGGDGKRRSSDERPEQ